MTPDELRAAHYEARERIRQRVVQDLLGPSAPDEVIADPPITRYVTGILFPGTDDGGGVVLDPDLDEDETEIGVAEPTVALANARTPTSMGMTFAVAPEAENLEIHVSAARYVPEAPRGAEDDDAGGPENEGDGDVEQERDRWRRVPVEADPIDIDLTTGVSRCELSEGLELYVRVREADRGGLRAVTVAIRNLLSATGLRDQWSFFQPSITARSPDGPVFRERPAAGASTNDHDLRSYRLLYRGFRSFATGHGCSAEWDSDGDTATEIRTTFVPHHQVPVAESNPAIDMPILSIKELAEAPRQGILEALADLVGRYETWIEERDAELRSEVPHELRDIGSEHLSECRKAAERMTNGIEALRGDADAWTAFRLMNRAMLEQRARAVWLSSGQPESGPDLSARHDWRAFQLAFILLCLPGILEEDERQIADLLWFPTGGGKTEAYLGLIAFALFIRRLRERRGGGVTVIMRYTLRLLTLQQFERASLLICACERIRREEAILGDDEISLGLWVGEAGTPTDLRGAREALDRLRRGEELSEGNPMQLRRCPWCGTALGPRNYFIGDRREQLIISCGEESCEFRRRLPVYVVDQDIYAYRPSLIIATADKFAALPWNDRVGNLFNLNHDDPPPELIIQDELHLISGPLGTLAGLYETAIDDLCSDGGQRRPKVIASTATIRRAQDQGLALFGREMRQFPPPALDQGDSWFAVEAPPERRGPRLYLGTMAPATSQATLLVRTYAALLQAAADLDVSDEVRDPYWTLVGYFNSLRVLGAARMQVQDDVRDRMRVLSGANARGLDNEIVELTSREASSEIPKHLQDMSIALPDERTIDVILATSMISVGVDIDRLGLMVVAGQPQATAEYIQATSRVGRTHPGLVVVLFNAARSRDRSHYESFVSYHGALYRQVESTSVTPFSSRSRERGVHAVLVGLTRLLEPGFGGNDGAAAAAGGRDVLERVRDRILERVRVVDPDEESQTKRELDDIIDIWVERARSRSDLLYAHPRDPERSLLVPASKLDADPEEMPTLFSLRDVDQESKLVLVP